jgi:hypothetical protein
MNMNGFCPVCEKPMLESAKQRTGSFCTVCERALDKLLTDLASDLQRAFGANFKVTYEGSKPRQSNTPTD